MERDWYGQIVPAVPRVQESVVVVFVLAGEENYQPAPYVLNHFLQHKRNTSKAEQARYALNTHHSIFVHPFCGECIAEPASNILHEITPQLHHQRLRFLEVDIMIVRTR